MDIEMVTHAAKQTPKRRSISQADAKADKENQAPTVRT